MYLLWVIILTLIVFLLVFFLSWWGKIRLVSSFALACAISLLFMVILYPPVQLATDIVNTSNMPGLIITYWIIYAILIFYIFVYVIYMSVTDGNSKKSMHKDIMQELNNSTDYLY